MKKMNNLIYRSNNLTTADENARTIRGYAVVFDSWSRDLGGFNEIIHRSAITQELVNSSNIIMNCNHDDNQMLARWVEGNGTLRLTLDEKGLAFEFEAPETERGNELLWNIRTGNLYECSFAFALPNNDKCQRWYRDEAGALKREINEIGYLFDTAIVTTAAYPATSVAARSENIDIEAICRSLDEEKAEEERLAKEAIDKKRNEKLTEKLSNFYKNIS